MRKERAGALPLDISTPKGRLSAVVNVLQNGGQTLEVLAMSSDMRKWTYYPEIATETNKLAGKEVVKHSATFAHLGQTIEPIGAAAKSSIDNRDWAITPFGLAMKPALIVGWINLLDLGLDSMQVLATTSKSANGPVDFKTTPAAVRTQLFFEIFEDPNIQIAELAKKVKIGASNVSKHIDALKANGLVNVESADPGEGKSITIWSVTDKGLETPDWFSKLPNGKVSVKVASEVTAAIQSRANSSEQLTLDTIMSGIDTKFPEKARERDRIRHVLQFFDKAGLLERGKLHSQHYSEVELTDLGYIVTERVLDPIKRWSEDPNSVDEINEVRRRFVTNPQAYADLYSQIADSYIANSPNKNADRGENAGRKLSRILALIGSQPDRLTYSDVGIALNIASSRIAKIVQPMLADGSVVIRKAEVGNKIYLSLGEQNSQN